MLEIQNVSKTFNAGTVNEKTALNGLNLKLNEGDFVTVIGGNGAGKSTMLNAVAGVWPVDSGKIIIDGTDVTKLGEHQRAAYIGRVFQDPMMGTAPNMQIEENLALAYRRGKKRTLRWGVTQAERKLFRDQLATLGLGLEDRMTAKVGLLSGGQRQALTLLMAALQTPKLLLLDEHTAALDPATAAKVLEISDKIVRDGKLTALMITHNMTDAIRHGNRLIMMDQGRIVLDISGEDKQKLTKAERERYRELLKSLDLGLEDRLTARVGLLSGGQRQALTLLMATMNKPKLLLLDEHTAALDPKTALKVLTLSARIVEENHLTTMMITHNMKDAIKYGNRLIMMHEGHIIYDVSGEEKKNLHVSDLLAKFQIASGGEFANDRMILS